MKKLLLCIFATIFASAACSSNDNAHTTVTIPIDPPPHQVLSVVNSPVPRSGALQTVDAVDTKKPYLTFYLENKKTFRAGDPVPIDFTVTNAKLKGEGGDYRVRYIVDDEEMKWLDTSAPFWLTGWTAGNHTVRIELIGPDGWPYKNGNANIVTREMTVQ